MDTEWTLPVAYGFDTASDAKNPYLARPKSISHVRFGSMAVVPQSKVQWRRHLAAVKRDYSNCRYRECTIKCQSLLQDAKDSDCVENAYAIFLHFYAATALEMQCRRVHHASKTRLEYLSQARDHYQQAAVVTASEEQTMSHSSLYSLSPSSTSDSTFSHHEPVSTRASSLNMCEAEHADSFGHRLDENMGESNTDKDQEQSCQGLGGNVNLNLDQELENAEEDSFHGKGNQEDGQGDQSEELVLSRPDSPTLGFDKWLGRSSPDILSPQLTTLNDLQDDTPGSEDRALAHSPVTPISHTIIVANTALDGFEADDDHYLDVRAESRRRGKVDARPDPYAASRSINQYRNTLASLRTQIASHLSHVTSEISSFHDPVSSRTLALNDEMRKMELQARIETLKAAGWKRRVFDADRYEALRDGAMGDMLS